MYWLAAKINLIKTIAEEFCVLNSSPFVCSLLIALQPILSFENSVSKGNDSSSNPDLA